MEERVKVGVGVLILKDGKLLMAKRAGKLGEGHWGTGGGHLEFNETPEQCAVREVKEEYGVDIGNLKFLCVCNIQKYGKHYIDIGFTAELLKGEPRIMEPEKFDEIDWFNLNNLPEPLFEAVRMYLDAHKTGKIYQTGD